MKTTSYSRFEYLARSTKIIMIKINIEVVGVFSYFISYFPREIIKSIKKSVGLLGRLIVYFNFIKGEWFRFVFQIAFIHVFFTDINMCRCCFLLPSGCYIFCNHHFVFRCKYLLTLLLWDLFFISNQSDSCFYNIVYGYSSIIHPLYGILILFSVLNCQC